MSYQLNYNLKVHDSKYREFLNVLENSLSKPKPYKCSGRVALQSITDMHIFEYKEIWTDIESLKAYVKSNEFLSLQGAFQLLTQIKNFKITELKELEKSSLFQNNKY